MAKTTDITVKILEQIRDEVRGVKDEVRQVKDEVRHTNGRLDRLEKRQTEAEVRLATELVAVVGAVNAARDAILEDQQLRRQVANHEVRLGTLERRVG